MDELKTNYMLQSMNTGKMYNDTGWMLDDPDDSTPCLLRTVYDESGFMLKDVDGLFKYAGWLPTQGFLAGSAAPVTYKSEGLASQLGLRNLWITFNGYWPEKGAFMNTCSFKETEAYSVCSRLKGYEGKTLVVASAGNTARAFAKVCSENNIPLVLCVPHDYIDALWFDKPISSCVKLYTTEPGSDYADAIHLSNIIAGMEGFTAEGGAKNVARRDGMGTTVLNAVATIGRIPDFYFQAVGSGTGAIAAWEANLRFIADGSFGTHKMRLMVSQNDPFIPIYTAWRQRSRMLPQIEDEKARLLSQSILAKVLSNRKPPYSIIGGLFDALTDTKGDVFKVTNDELVKASELFSKTEGIDIHPAAAVATASLIQAVNSESVSPDSVIMLNITGGGEQRFKSSNEVYYLKPLAVFKTSSTFEEITEIINQPV